MGADEMAGIFGCRNDRRAEAVHLLFPPVLSSIGHKPPCTKAGPSHERHQLCARRTALDGHERVGRMTIPGSTGGSANQNAWLGVHAPDLFFFWR